MHYVNGREAKVGDLVVGKLFNTKGLVSGTLVSLTPGNDSCSAMVGFLETKPVEEILRPPTHFVMTSGTEQHGNAGALATTFATFDYSECKYLLHVEDVPAYGSLLKELAK
jgi:hypothetical protein